MASSIKTTKFFLSGATGASPVTPATSFVFIFLAGYIGGAVLTRFLQHPNAASFEFTLLVRNAEKAEGFRRMGLNTFVGSLADEALLERLSSEADVVIATVHNHAPHRKPLLKENVGGRRRPRCSERHAPGLAEALRGDGHPADIHEYRGSSIIYGLLA
jgi:hypothetical protein